MLNRMVAALRLCIVLLSPLVLACEGLRATAVARLRVPLIVTVALASCAVLSCAGGPSPETVADKANAAIEKAEEHTEFVLEALETAKGKTGPLAEVLAEVEAFREAFDAEEYSKALGHLRAAMATTSDAGYSFPEEVPRRLAEAQLLLGFLGK